MKKTLKYLLTATAILGLVACGRNNSDSSKTENEPLSINEVVTSTFVSPTGQKLDKIVYRFNQLSDDIDTSKLSIKITDTQVDFLTKEETVTEIDPKIESINQESNEVVIDIEDLAYSTITDIQILDDNDLLTSRKENMVLETMHADNFQKNIFTDSKGTEITYWLYEPQNSNVSKPLVIWEHGGGEVLATSYEGANIVSSQGATTWLEHGYDTMVLSVQYPENYSFGISEIPEELKLMEAFNDAKYELIQSLINDGKVDSNRVTITGASSGGGGALRFLMQYPDLFAGALVTSAKDTIVPISKKYDLAYQLEDKAKLKITDEQYEETYKEMSIELGQYPSLVNVPIWFVQAENDQVTTYYTSEMMDKVLRDMGATDNKITLYTDKEMEEAGVKDIYHGSWQLAYQDKEMLDWLMGQSR